MINSVNLPTSALIKPATSQSNRQFLAADQARLEANYRPVNDAIKSIKQINPRVIEVAHNQLAQHSLKTASYQQKNIANQPGYQTPQQKYQFNQQLIQRDQIADLIGISILV